MTSRAAILLSTSLAPIWGSTYLVTTEFLPPNRPFTAALIRVLPAGLLLLAWTRRMGDRCLARFFEHRLFPGHAVYGGVPLAGRTGGGAEFHADADGAGVHLAD